MRRINKEKVAQVLAEPDPIRSSRSNLSSDFSLSSGPSEPGNDEEEGAKAEHGSFMIEKIERDAKAEKAAEDDTKLTKKMNSNGLADYNFVGHWCPMTNRKGKQGKIEGQQKCFAIFFDPRKELMFRETRGQNQKWGKASAKQLFSPLANDKARRFSLLLPTSQDKFEVQMRDESYTEVKGSITFELNNPEACPWRYDTTHKDSTPLCTDGTYVTDSPWQCGGEGGHGQRLMCPPRTPFMCAGQCAGHQHPDHCCSETAQACDALGGIRPCPQASTTEPRLPDDERAILEYHFWEGQMVVKNDPRATKQNKLGENIKFAAGADAAEEESGESGINQFREAEGGKGKNKNKEPRMARYTPWVVFKQVVGELQKLHDDKKVAHLGLNPDWMLCDESTDPPTVTIKNGAYRNDWFTYMAPEVLQQSDLNHIDYDKVDGYKVDIWALGVALYEFLVGEVPWPMEDGLSEADVQAAMEAKMERGLFIPSEKVTDIAAQLIRKMLKRKPAERISLEEVSKHPYVTQEK